MKSNNELMMRAVGAGYALEGKYGEYAYIAMWQRWVAWFNRVRREYW